MDLNEYGLLARGVDHLNELRVAVNSLEMAVRECSHALARVLAEDYDEEFGAEAHRRVHRANRA